MNFPALTTLAFLSLSLIACDDGGAEQAILQRKAELRRADPPALWSVDVVGEEAAGLPIQICANSRVVSGFSSILPTVAGKPCLSMEGMIPTENGVRFRCRVDGVTYAISSATVGDPKQRFDVSSSAHAISEDRPAYARTLRFTRLANACPTGWKVGEATDRQGVRRIAFDATSE